MNTKQKILTCVALLVFGGIVASGVSNSWRDPWGAMEGGIRLTWKTDTGRGLSPTATSLVILAVVYTGLFFVLSGGKRK